MSGMVISGVLTDLTSWRWIFLINLPVAAVALVLVPRLVTESRAGRRVRLAVPGTVLGTAGVLSLVYGLLQAGESGWADPAVVATLLLAAALAAGFLAAESRAAAPLVPRSLPSDRTRAVANGATLLFSAAFYAMAFLLMIHLQTVQGMPTAGTTWACTSSRSCSRAGRSCGPAPRARCTCRPSCYRTARSSRPAAACTTGPTASWNALQRGVEVEVPGRRRGPRMSVCQRHALGSSDRVGLLDGAQ